ncbi:MAG: phosphotransferase [Pseudomonadota bacterium]
MSLENQRQQWLNNVLQHQKHSVIPLAGDASFRRYSRVHLETTHFILMDAPPTQENTAMFLLVAEYLHQHHVRVPKIIAQEPTQGWVLLEDFGDDLLSTVLNANSVEVWYQRALRTLGVIQRVPPTQAIPLYSEQLLNNEMELCPQWFFDQLLQRPLNTSELKIWQQQRDLLTQMALQQPQVFVHRDYHSRNLLVLPDNDLGVIDFQDAVYGAVTYDVVSILKDCYVRWPVHQVQEWAISYYSEILIPFLKEKNQSIPSQATFLKWFDWMGIQRHLKVLGIFARLYLRDKKSGYLADLPRVAEYTLEACRRYPELKPLLNMLEHRIMNEDQNGYSLQQALHKITQPSK